VVLRPDRRNGERNGRTDLALNRIHQRLDDVRRAVATGRRKVIMESVDAAVPREGSVNRRLKASA
jgi:hypothetical protein